ncbi:MAG: bifunctional UDP-N-acetylglucosamine diphosphorylase/glucosamine-1-phosphate N-acetyltransferase GlmU [Clostridia bacterium]|nr:bifunctional UDP-N-acetylglucosamine diphosphorylase/glucosamine-1-phosphate N-acetyltransferase GlmU [Clostridia bacterium]
MGGTVAVVMAAGRGTRMKSELPKVLHPVAGEPMVRLVVRAVAGAGVARTVVVVGEDGERVQAVLGPGLGYAVQAEPKGTGHAVLQAAGELGDCDRVLVVNGDMPLLTPDTLAGLIAAHEARDRGEAPLAATLLLARFADPTGYGRVVRDDSGEVARIVEDADATADERAIDECYTGCAVFEWRPLREALSRLRPDNQKGELYLTDAVRELRAAGFRVRAHAAPDGESCLGVNDRRELARAARILRRRKLEELMRAGVTVVDPDTTYVELAVEVGPDTTIHPFTILAGATVVGARCRVGPAAEVVDSRLSDDVVVTRSVVEGSELGRGVRIGPFAHLRPGTRVGDESEIGNYAEVKASRLGRQVKVHHHSYIGDAAIGDRVNVGAGVVTVNFDGRRKHATEVGDDAFLGCNANLVAPVRVGPGAYVAAGSTITKDVPEEALAIARERQTNKDGWARRFGRGKG